MLGLVVFFFLAAQSEEEIKNAIEKLKKPSTSATASRKLIRYGKKAQKYLQELKGLNPQLKRLVKHILRMIEFKEEVVKRIWEDPPDLEVLFSKKFEERFKLLKEFLGKEGIKEISRKDLGLFVESIFWKANPQQMDKAMEFFEEDKPEDGWRILIEMLRVVDTPSPRFVKLLRKYNVEELEEKVGELLESEDFMVRSNAVVVLYEIKSERAKEILQEHLKKEKDFRVKMIIEIVLQKGFDRGR